MDSSGSDSGIKIPQHEIEALARCLYPKMIAFFETGVAPVTHEQTIDVIAVRTAAVKAAETTRLSQSILSYDKNSAVAMSYLNFAEEVLKYEREGQTKYSRVQAR